MAATAWRTRRGTPDSTPSGKAIHGRDGYPIPISEGDIREGGRFRTCMRAPDGKDHWLGGTYTEIKPPERIVFTHAWQNEAGESDHGTTVTVSLEDLGDKTRLTLHQAFFRNAAERDGHHEGWSETLDNLASYLVGESGGS